MSGRRREGYFKPEPGGCSPVETEVRRRVGFSEADMMGVVWFGRYPLYFEEGSAELGRRCGLSYRDFRAADLQAPVAECHVDYHAPLRVDDVITIRARLVWTDAARLNTEYEIRKDDGELAASGYTVQMITDAGGVCLVPPPLLEAMRERWRRGEFGA